MKKFLWAVLIASVTAAQIVTDIAWGNNEESKAADGNALPRAAIFVQNLAGEPLDNKVDSFRSLLATRLSNIGFSIVDKEEVLDTFKKSNDRVLQDVGVYLEKDNVDAALTSVSILNLSQLIRADYIIVAAIETFGSQHKRATAYGINSGLTEYSLRVGLKVLEGGHGGAVYGDTIRVTDKIMETGNLSVTDRGEVINNLLDSGARELASKVGSKIRQIQEVKVKHEGVVPFRITIADGYGTAAIEIDGAVIGTAGPETSEFTYSPGIHRIRVTGQWFEPWERRINIYADQHLKISPQLSPEGIARFKDLEGFKTEMYVKKQLADGEKKRLEESYERIDTSGAKTLVIGEQEKAVIIKKTEE